MDLTQVSGIGFVGLGAMGLPMAGHLANKLPGHIRLFVYDINQDSVNQLHNDYPDRVVKASSAKDATDQSVSIYAWRGHFLAAQLAANNFATANSPDDAARGETRPISVYGKRVGGHLLQRCIREASDRLLDDRHGQQSRGQGLHQ